MEQGFLKCRYTVQFLSLVFFAIPVEKKPRLIYEFSNLKLGNRETIV